MFVAIRFIKLAVHFQMLDTKTSTICNSERKLKVLVAQSCPTLWDPMDCSLPGSSVHGIFQARVLQWVAISFSRGIFPTQGSKRVNCIGRWFLYLCVIRDVHTE